MHAAHCYLCSESVLFAVIPGRPASPTSPAEAMEFDFEAHDCATLVADEAAYWTEMEARAADALIYGGIDSRELPF